MQRLSHSERRKTGAARRTPQPPTASNCPSVSFSSENGSLAAFSQSPPSCSLQSHPQRQEKNTFCRANHCESQREMTSPSKKQKKFKKTLDFPCSPCYYNEAVSQEAHGVLAQLGERHTGSVEVSGSIPLCSTIIRTLCQTARSSDFLFCLSFTGKMGKAGAHREGGRPPFCISAMFSGLRHQTHPFLLSVFDLPEPQIVCFPHSSTRKPP